MQLNVPEESKRSKFSELLCSTRGIGRCWNSGGKKVLVCDHAIEIVHSSAAFAIHV